MSLPMLCVDEPYATAIMLGLKRWETRTCPPNGDMRPDGVRGFPGVKVDRGDRIIIASTKRRPRHEQRDVNGDVPLWCDLYTFVPFVEWTEYPDDFMHGGMYRWSGPVGVILGTVAVTAAAAITTHADIGDPECIVASAELLDHCIPSWEKDQPDSDPAIVRLEPPFVPDGAHLIRDISDQLPWGDWTPGRWAWALADPIPTTEQCPWCFGDGGFKEDSMLLYGVPGGEDWDYGCPVCTGKGSCPPIPVTGHQGLREWSGEVRS